MSTVKLSTIMVEYARRFGCGLPLSPEQMCNAVVLWVQENYGGGNETEITAELLLNYLEGSDTVVVDLNEAGDKIEIHIDYEIINKIDRALLIPTTIDIVDRIPIIPKSKREVIYVDKSSIGGHYKHQIRTTEGLYLIFYSQVADPYTEPKQVEVSYADGTILFFCIDQSITNPDIGRAMLVQFNYDTSTSGNPYGNANIKLFYVKGDGTIGSYSFNYGEDYGWADQVG